MDKALGKIAFTIENRTSNAHTTGVRLSFPVNSQYELRQDGKVVPLVQTGDWDYPWRAELSLAGPHVEDRAGSTVIKVVAGCVAVLGVHLLAQTPAPTRVVRFVPTALPEHGKPGECQASLAAGYRNDAFRCTADNTTYDPCFATAKTWTHAL